MSKSSRSVVIFDLGGVLVDWNPRHLYRKLFPGDEAAMEHFLAHVCNDAWNIQQDAGRGFPEAVKLLVAEHPDKAPLIEAYWQRWAEMLNGPLHGTVDILEDLHRRGVPLYALTNWASETFVIAKPLFPFLDRFRGIVVSGHERLVKPDPRIYRILLERYGIDAASAVYIDDNRHNVEAAAALGLHAIHFRSPDALRHELEGLGLLTPKGLYQK